MPTKDDEPHTFAYREAKEALGRAEFSAEPLTLYFRAETYGGPKAARSSARSLCTRVAQVRAREHVRAVKRGLTSGPFDTIHVAMLSDDNGQDTRLVFRRKDNFHPFDIQVGDGPVESAQAIAEREKVAQEEYERKFAEAEFADAKG